MARKGLGRTFDSLLGINDNPQPQEEANISTEERIESLRRKMATGEVSEVDITDIDPNYEQPRKNFDQQALKELADSIKSHGIIQPIVLVRMGMRYMIIAGERRWRAAKLAGLKTVPAVVKNYTPQQIKEVSLIENLQREDLNPVETARAIKQLMEECNMTQESVADRLGKSRPAIANTLRLLSLDDRVLDMIEKNKLSAGHARTLVVVSDADAQLKLAQKACNMSVRDTEKMVREYLNPKPQKVKVEQSIELKELVANMQRVFATKVGAIGNDNKGRLYIDYYTKDDLDRICAMVEDLRQKAAEENNEI